MLPCRHDLTKQLVCVLQAIAAIALSVYKNIDHSMAGFIKSKQTSPRTRFSVLTVNCFFMRQFKLHHILSFLFENAISQKTYVSERRCEAHLSRLPAVLSKLLVGEATKRTWAVYIRNSGAKHSNLHVSNRLLSNELSRGRPRAVQTRNSDQERKQKISARITIY